MEHKGFRVLRPGESPDIPPAAQDGDWHLTPQAGKFYCPFCRDYEYEQACVKRYHPERDQEGAQAEQHPGWAEKGWLAWFQCDNCAWNRFKAVKQQLVERWGRELGGWELRVMPDPNDPEEIRRQNRMLLEQRSIARIMDEIFGGGNQHRNQ